MVRIRSSAENLSTIFTYRTEIEFPAALWMFDDIILIFFVRVFGAIGYWWSFCGEFLDCQSSSMQRLAEPQYASQGSNDDSNAGQIYPARQPVILWVDKFFFFFFRNLLELAAVAHCTSSEGIGNSSSKEASNHLDMWAFSNVGKTILNIYVHGNSGCVRAGYPIAIFLSNPEELHVAQQIHLLRKWSWANKLADPQEAAACPALAPLRLAIFSTSQHRASSHPTRTAHSPGKCGEILLVESPILCK